ncbi:hypothetical protein BDQ12DRAFT_672609 [Crucibulum laeve]|uniref:Glycopeptide n=1 Tax=Crucibulum laeve TaxID=68775 RepID=A0A5C3MFP0_9AGAR|nr:hypothetical protein BDQ12DRAFT_672609 [Crucibulum laeve]
MALSSFFTVLVTFFVFTTCVSAETHTIKFDNQCGHGTPRLIKAGNILSNGEPYTTNGSFSSGIAYLQTGNCLLNGEGCTLVEMTLTNPTCAGCGSSTDISLIPPLKYSVPTSFSYFGGCNGQGAKCTSANCNTAFFVPDDNQVQVACQDNNVNLLITFCPDGSETAPAPVATVNKPAVPTVVQAAVESSTAPKPTSSSVSSAAVNSSSATSPAKKCVKKHAQRIGPNTQRPTTQVRRAHRLHRRNAHANAGH